MILESVESLLHKLKIFQDKKPCYPSFIYRQSTIPNLDLCFKNDNT